LTFYQANGYAVARELFSGDEVAAYRDHFMRLRAEGPKPGDMIADTKIPGDPLTKFPRMIQMHRWDDVTHDWLLDPRLRDVLTQLLGAEPYAVQSMLYFKPAGARGQALHQDNFYLQVKPGTCMAAWLALDDCDEENGCMQVVPGSHEWSVLCHVKADASVSFTDITAPLLPQHQPVALRMKAGDVLFFHGSLVHGSYPNTSRDRFRRSLIGHYVEGNTVELTAGDQPVLTFAGEEKWLIPSPGGFPCGQWSEEKGPATIVVNSRTQQKAVAHG
jgi:ectoine hydroxylase-related dioxygenase (phytanoyl-CoA dioxygenase family)